MTPNVNVFKTVGFTLFDHNPEELGTKKEQFAQFLEK